MTVFEGKTALAEFGFAAHYQSRGRANKQVEIAESAGRLGGFLRLGLGKASYRLPLWLPYSPLGRCCPIGPATATVLACMRGGIWWTSTNVSPVPTLARPVVTALPGPVWRGRLREPSAPGFAPRVRRQNWADVRYRPSHQRSFGSR